MPGVARPGTRSSDPKLWVGLHAPGCRDCDQRHVELTESRLRQLQGKVPFKCIHGIDIIQLYREQEQARVVLAAVQLPVEVRSSREDRVVTVSSTATSSVTEAKLEERLQDLSSKYTALTAAHTELGKACILEQVSIVEHSKYSERELKDYITEVAEEFDALSDEAKELTENLGRQPEVDVDEQDATRSWRRNLW